MAQNSVVFSIDDYNKESSKTSLNIGPLTAVNFTAVRDAIDDYKTALAGMIIGAIRKTTISEQFAESSAAVTDQNAQRERKWIVTYRDTTQFFDVANTINNVGFGNLYSIEVPTAKASLLGNNQEVLDLTVTAVAAYVAAFEAIQNSPTGGNETDVVEIKLVGRNL